MSAVGLGAFGNVKRILLEKGKFRDSYTRNNVLKKRNKKKKIKSEYRF